MDNETGSRPGDSRQTTAAERQTPTVAQAILAAYFDRLATTGGFVDIAENLRRTVIEGGQFSDAAIRAALFPDGP